EIGARGTVVGTRVGDARARSLVELVLRTIGDLYFGAAVTAVAPSPEIYVRGALLGLAGPLLGGAKPALDAARGERALALRRADLERRSRHRAHVAVWLAVPVAAAGLLLTALGPSSLRYAFAGLCGVWGGCALLVPAATLLLMRLLEAATRRGASLPSLLAMRGVGASLRRTSVATAALP